MVVLINIKEGGRGNDFFINNVAAITITYILNN